MHVTNSFYRIFHVLMQNYRESKFTKNCQFYKKKGYFTVYLCPSWQKISIFYLIFTVYAGLSAGQTDSSQTFKTCFKYLVEKVVPMAEIRALRNVFNSPKQQGKLNCLCLSKV